ncbi:MAG: efflux RND transporter periplasmic adaptor subunit, partial [Anaerolineales bacterium]|nr:efflux RND transporter periplasmic adaptor subunit [Anaerolineales bacterium]
MPHRRPPLPAMIILVLILLLIGYFSLRALLNEDTDGVLTASGTIEAVTITISPEIGGKVAEVYVDEGDTVRAGDPLFRLDDTLLQAQRTVAIANLDLARAAAETAKRAQETAEANYTLSLNAAHLEASASRTLDWHTPALPGYTLPGGYFTQNEQIVAARAEVEAARAARDTARAALNDLLTAPANADFVAAENRLAQARIAFLTAQDTLARARLSNNANLRDAAQSAYDSAQTELERAQAAYDALAGTEGGKAIISARAELAVYEERYQAAQDRLLALQIGLESPKVTAAQASLNQAVEAARQAQLAIAQAEASLALLDAQIAKLTVVAPADGVILTRSIQPGEVVSPGATALKLGRLNDLTITVYIPEDRYGQLSLGQAASVTVDSFPGKTFQAVIVHIADQAEFTPRNVQTVEGRSSTVYAIRLRVQDPEGKLKPGMPADVRFSPSSEGRSKLYTAFAVNLRKESFDFDIAERCSSNELFYDRSGKPPESCSFSESRPEYHVSPSSLPTLTCS